MNKPKKSQKAQKTAQKKAETKGAEKAGKTAQKKAAKKPVKKAAKTAETIGAEKAAMKGAEKKAAKTAETKASAKAVEKGAERAEKKGAEKGDLKSPDFTERVVSRLNDFLLGHNDDACARARSEYVESEAHREFSIAAACLPRFGEIINVLVQGKVVDHLAICCCADTFAAILTNHPDALYDEILFSSTIRETFPADEIDRLFDIIPDSDELADALVENGYCTTSPFQSRFVSDANNQADYYRSLVSLVEQFIRLAHAHKSPSVRGFAEVLRLLTPLPKGDMNYWPLGVSRDNARAAYGVLLKAHADLWADLYVERLGK